MKARIENLMIKSKKRIDWTIVENYLKRYDKKEYIISSTNDIIRIDKHFIDEYTGSIHTRSLKGTMALVKANIPIVLEEVIKNAFNRVFEENRKLKHKGTSKKEHLKNLFFKNATNLVVPTGTITRKSQNLYFFEVPINHLLKKDGIIIAL